MKLYEEIEKLSEIEREEILVFLINRTVVRLNSRYFEIDVKSKFLDYQIQIKLIEKNL